MAEEVTSRSMIALFSNMNTAEYFDTTDHTITLFNTLPYSRHSVIPLVIDLPKPSGPVVDIGVGGAASAELFYDIIDIYGKKIPAESLRERT